jgi:hypothetical protein
MPATEDWLVGTTGEGGLVGTGVGVVSFLGTDADPAAIGMDDLL